MILSEKQVLDLVKAPIDPIIDVNRKLQDDHKVHINGVGFEQKLIQIIGYEDVEQFRQKKLLTKPFTRSLFKKIKNAQSRWKTAMGTSKFYKFKEKSPELSKQFKDDVLSQVWKNGSMDSFIKDFLSNALYEEFNGFLLIERGQIVKGENGQRYEVRGDIMTPVKESENIKPYICFKSVDEVHTFKITGKMVEFIVLKFGMKPGVEGKSDIELYRVIDDKYDYIVEKESDRVSISTEYPRKEHKAGRCPASSITHVNQTLVNDRTKTSPVDDIIQTLDYHLHQFAEHLVTEILHAHPNFFQVGRKCTHEIEGNICEGGRIKYEKNGEKFDVICPSCNGRGHDMKKDASKVTVIPAKDDEGKPFNITNIMGYVAPPIDALEYQQSAIDWMKNEILEAATGINNFAQSEGLEKTATGVVANIKPLEQIISDIIDVIESVEKNITDLIGRIYYGEKYVGSEIIYGRRLILRDENVLVREIQESKKAGASVSHMKALYDELTYTRFVRSSIDLQRAVMLNELEPLIGFTFDEVESSENIPQEVKVLKQNFIDIIQRFELENEDIVEFMQGSDLKKKIGAIKEKLSTYVAQIIESNRAATQQQQSGSDTAAAQTAKP